MTQTLPLLKFSLTNSSTKENIIIVLSQKWPLNTRDIYNELQKNTKNELTYQAIHKAVTQLEEDGVIEKHGLEWKLKKEWLQKGEEFFKNNLEIYNGLLNKYNIIEPFEGSKIFKFDNFSELCVKTAELLANKILTKNGKGDFICVLEYGWWTIKFKFEQLELLYRMMKNCPNSKSIIRKETSFGRWIRKQYNYVGGVTAPIGTNINIEEDICIQGDYIMEIEISSNGKKIIEQYWNKWRNLNDLFKDFGLKEEPAIESTVKITKNPELANFMRKELEKYFKT